MICCGKEGRSDRWWMGCRQEGDSDRWWIRGGKVVERRVAVKGMEVIGGGNVVERRVKVKRGAKKAGSDRW